MDMVIDKDAKPYDVHKYRTALTAGEAPHPVFCGGKDADGRPCEADAVACAFGPGRKVNPYFRAHHIPACDEGRHLSVTELPGDQGHLRPVQLGLRTYFLQEKAEHRSPELAAMRKPDDQTAGDTTLRRVRLENSPDHHPSPRPRPRGLQRILRDLHHEAFDPSATFHVPQDPNFPRLPFADFFVRAAEMRTDHRGTHRGWWGLITRAWIAKKGSPPNSEPPTWLELDDATPRVLVRVPAPVARILGLYDGPTVGRVVGARAIFLGHNSSKGDATHFISLPAEKTDTYLYIDTDRSLTA